MFPRGILLGALLCLAAPFLRADFSYEQTTKISGGAMMGMVKLAGAFSKQATEPVVSTVMVSGNRMANVSAHRISVIDVDKETVTDIDLDKKTYATITFADMQKAMERMAEKMRSHKQAPDAPAMSFKADVKSTGQTKQILGLDTKETILTVVMEGTDQKTGQSGGMTVVSDLWLAGSVAGYDEVRNFYRRMGEKMAWSPNSMGGLGMARPDLQQGMAELARNAAKLEGVPVYQTMKLGVQGDPSAAGSQPAAKQNQAPPPTAGDLAGRVMASRLGLGGLGGLGRKKKSADQDQTSSSPSPTGSTSNSDAPGNATGSGSGSLMEITVETTGFSSGPVDGSKFEIPAGYKQIEHHMEKALR